MYLRRLALGLLLALVALPPLASVSRAASTDYVANCDTRLRDSTSTSAATVDIIDTGTVVTASGTVSGESWSADCGSSTSGSAWYAITAVDGTSTSTLYGVDTVYAATGLFSPAPAPADWLEGVDVSKWQGSIDYSAVQGSGRSFVIAKATEGYGYLDPRWGANRAGALAAGLRLGGYHFARPDLNPTTDGARNEADWFVDQLGLADGMLVPALDLEVHGSLGVTALTDWVKAWLQEVYDRTGVRAMIYTSPSFWRTYLKDTRWFADNGYPVLWVAHWTTKSSPSVPASNWGGRSWTFWQYTSDGSVPGIGGRVDLDRYNGTDLTKVTVGADFGLDLAGPSTIEKGAAGTFSISIARNWFSLPVSLSVGGLPSAVDAALGTTSTTGSDVSFSLDTSGIPAGAYTITVTGTANGLTRTASAPLTVTDASPPTVVPPLTVLQKARLGSSVPVHTTWSASDPSGIAAYASARQVNGGSWSGLTNGSSTAISQRLNVWAAYRYRVNATDGASNTSAWVNGPTFKPVLIQQSSSAIKYSSGWKGVYIGSASSHHVRYATRAGAWASYTFTGRSIGWVAVRGPSRGAAVVYIDGKYRTTVQLHSSTYHSQQIVFTANWRTSGSHTIKIVVKGTSGHPRVDIDAFVELVNA
jgi:GH25 family lysozyme M1 (1,4-beta-N-acetylmuramidase)